MGWFRKQKNHTENGPRYESKNPGSGCNSTYVAKGRRDWHNRRKRRLDKMETKLYQGTGPNTLQPPKEMLDEIKEWEVGDES